MKSIPTLSLGKRILTRKDNRKKKRVYRPRFDTLEDRIVPAAPVIQSIPDQSLVAFGDSKDITIDATDADGNALTYWAESAASTAYFLDQDLQLVPSSVTELPKKIDSTLEVWFKRVGLSE